MRTDPCGVYVHVPFCRRRCPYCDFAFEVRAADPRFVDAVAAELRGRWAELPSAPSSLSLGGGTPSSLREADLARLVEEARALGLAADAEISLEVNPEDDVAPAGFTRVSLGVQSFDDDVLAWLGRAHDGKRARDAVAAYVRTGRRVGVDLIVGVPGERHDRLARDVETCVALGVGHVSAYLLTVEAGTPLVQLIARKQREAVDDDVQAMAYEDVQRRLTAAGYAQYEVSSYARPGEESRHNRVYWQGGTYLGVGPSAHSMRRLDDGRVRRRQTTARFDAWVMDPLRAAIDVEELEPAHALREAVAFGLRDLAAGVDLAALARRHAVPAGARVLDDVRAALDAAAAAGDLIIDGDRARLTSKGARFADRVARAVLA